MDRVQELIWEICDDLKISRSSSALEMAQMVAKNIVWPAVLNREQKRKIKFKKKIEPILRAGPQC